MASALLQFARGGHCAARGTLLAAAARSVSGARRFASDTDATARAATPTPQEHKTPSKYGPSASWITAGMLLRMRRPRAATTLGGRWAEGCLTIRADETVAQAVRLMAAHEVGCLVVMDDRAGDEVAGVITERTYSRKIILQGRDSDTTRVGDVMKTQVVCVHAEEKLDVVAEVLSQRRIRHLPVVGGPEMAGAPGPDHVLGLPAPASGLRGVLSVKDVAWMLFCLIRNELQGQGIGSITVRDILSRMPAPPAPEGGPEHAAAHHPPFSIHEERSVLDAIAEMARLNTHALVVLDRRGSLSGIITERDYIYKVKVAGLTSIDTLVSEIMTPTPWCASLDFTLDDVLTVMTRYGFRHMPVVGSVGEPEPGGEPPRVDDGGSSPFRPRCHGIISITDVMRTICEWQDRPLSWPDNEPPMPGPL